MKNKVVKMRVHAGGGWEGHVVFTAIHPENPEDHHLSSNLEEVFSFCEKRGLSMDENFYSLVLEFLAYQQNHGFIVPILDKEYKQIIDKDKPITSCSSYLKKNFSDYY